MLHQKQGKKVLLSKGFAFWQVTQPFWTTSPMIWLKILKGKMKTSYQETWHASSQEHDYGLLEFSAEFGWWFMPSKQFCDNNFVHHRTLRHLICKFISWLKERKSWFIHREALWITLLYFSRNETTVDIAVNCDAKNKERHIISLKTGQQTVWLNGRWNSLKFAREETSVALQGEADKESLNNRLSVCVISTVIANHLNALHLQRITEKGVQRYRQENCTLYC